VVQEACKKKQFVKPKREVMEGIARETPSTKVKTINAYLTYLKILEKKEPECEELFKVLKAKREKDTEDKKKAEDEFESKMKDNAFSSNKNAPKVQVGVISNDHFTNNYICNGERDDDKKEFKDVNKQDWLLCDKPEGKAILNIDAFKLVPGVNKASVETSDDFDCMLKTPKQGGKDMKTRLFVEPSLARERKWEGFLFAVRGKKKTEQLEEGLRDALDKLFEQKCDGSTNVMIFFGGSGAGKTTQTNAIMTQFVSKRENVKVESFLELYFMSVFDLLCDAADSSTKQFIVQVDVGNEKKEPRHKEEFNKFAKAKPCRIYTTKMLVGKSNPHSILANGKTEFNEARENQDKKLIRANYDVKDDDGQPLELEAQYKPKPIQGGTDMKGCLKQGMSRRVTKATKYNPFSSRGHAVMTITESKCKLVIADLAGYEDPYEASRKAVGNGLMVYYEGATLVEGIQAVGDGLEDLANANGRETPDMEKSNNILLKMLHLTGQRFMNAMFMVCISMCGPGKGRLEGTFRSLDIGERALNVRLKKKGDQCVKEDVCGICGSINQVERVENGKCECEMNFNECPKPK